MTKTATSAPPESYKELRAEMAGRYDGLTKRLRQIAEYALANPNDMALETVAVIAERAEIQPSSLIRFAKAFGYDGFSTMQQVYRRRLIDQRPSYSERIRAFGETSDGDSQVPLAVLDRFVGAAVLALNNLNETVEAEALEHALESLVSASTIYVVGQRRAFPVAAYLGYAFAQLGRRTVLVDSIGGMLSQQASAIRAEDAVVAVSFHPYSPESLQVVEHARDRGAAIVAITDGPLSPLVGPADVSFEVEEAQVESFRALSASMCLALALVVGLGYRLGAANGTTGSAR
ncbi:MAG: MurR/RpiR family transcriptional regulator [Alphaproteobacteria bacterium]|nr:MurR/RpiR family transcriptional regulator [Alphaproteobacteria bacterium]